MGTRPLEVSEVSNISFAQQVRTERLDIIWKSALVLISVVAWFFVALSGYQDTTSLLNALVPWGIMLVACFLCHAALQGDHLELATWLFAAGILGAMGFLMYNSGDETRQLVPFTSLIAIYVVGSMLPARAMPPLLVSVIGVIIGIPWIADGRVTVPSTGAFLAIGLGMVAALLSVQASGELFSIAEWALENYRRERESASRLFESRQQVERSLLRQQALTKELSETNEELAIARQAAEEAKHFRGQFLANMSHELRTPLNAVIGFSETMLNFPQMYSDIPLPDEYRKDLEQINSSGKHLLNIINDILDLSKIDAGRLEIELQKVDLEPIFKGVLSTGVGLVGGKPIKLHRETPKDLPAVKGDPVRIRQVLLNIYSNAAKFTEKGSINLEAKFDEKEVTISVTDTGEGIHPSDIDKIFEEFRQGTAGRKRARAGAGLGMAISRQLLSLMGGRIWVESELGKGSTFFFTLPIYQEEPASKAAEGEPVKDEGVKEEKPAETETTVVEAKAGEPEKAANGQEVVEKSAEAQPEPATVVVSK